MFPEFPPAAVKSISAGVGVNGLAPPRIGSYPGDEAVRAAPGNQSGGVLISSGA